MSKQLSVIALVLVAAVIGQGAFFLLERNRVSVSFAADLFENSGVPASGYHLEWEPNFGNGSMSFRQTYRLDETDVTMYVITYLSSQPDSELIRYERTLVDSEKWKLSAFTGTSAPIELMAGLSPNISIVSSANGHEKLAVMYWYDVGGKPLSSKYLAKLHSIINIFRLREDSTAVVLAAPCEGDCEGEMNIIRALVTTIYLDPAGRYHGIVIENGAR